MRSYFVIWSVWDQDGHRFYENKGDAPSGADKVYVFMLPKEALVQALNRDIDINQARFGSAGLALYGGGMVGFSVEQPSQN